MCSCRGECTCNKSPVADHCHLRVWQRAHAAQQWKFVRSYDVAGGVTLRLYLEQFIAYPPSGVVLQRGRYLVQAGELAEEFNVETVSQPQLRIVD